MHSFGIDRVGFGFALDLGLLAMGQISLNLGLLFVELDLLLDRSR